MTNKRLRTILGERIEKIASPDFEKKNATEKENEFKTDAIICSLAKQYINSLDIAVRMRRLDIDEEKIDVKSDKNSE